MSVEFKNFEQLLQAAKDLPTMPVAVIDAEELHVVEGACTAARAGYIDPILIGDEAIIRDLLATLNCAQKYRIIHAAREDVMAEKGIDGVGSRSR